MIQLFRAGLLLVAVLTTAASHAQDTRYTPDELDYYLFSAYLTADSAQRPRIDHIGALYEQRGGNWYIRSLLEGYPAVNAGLYRGDKVLSVDSRPFHPVHSFNSSASSPSGQSPGVIEIVVERAGQKQSFTVTPVHENLYDAVRHATQHSISRYPSGNKIVCYVHWWTASRSLSDLIADRQMFADLRLCDALILDLRDAFGWFDWEQLDHFYGSRRGYPELEVHSPGAGPADTALVRHLAPDLSAQPDFSGHPYFGRPMAVLINDGTRGGMELIAWDLIDSGRALSVGIPSAGLITGTAVPVLDAEGVTFTPHAELWIDGQPVQRAEPRILQPWPLEAAGRNDPQFDAALFALLGII